MNSVVWPLTHKLLFSSRVPTQSGRVSDLVCSVPGLQSMEKIIQSLEHGCFQSLYKRCVKDYTHKNKPRNRRVLFWFIISKLDDCAKRFQTSPNFAQFCFQNLEVKYEGMVWLLMFAQCVYSRNLFTFLVTLWMSHGLNICYINANYLP